MIAEIPMKKKSKNYIHQKPGPHRSKSTGRLCKSVRATTEKNPSAQFNVNKSTEIKNVRSLENCFYYTLYYCIIKISYYKN